MKRWLVTILLMCALPISVVANPAKQRGQAKGHFKLPGQGRPRDDERQFEKVKISKEARRPDLRVRPMRIRVYPGRRFGYRTGPPYGHAYGYWRKHRRVRVGPPYGHAYGYRRKHGRYYVRSRY